MTQYPLPGVQQQYKGADFRGTAGVHAAESGGVSTRVVVYSELERQRQQLEQAYESLQQYVQQADAQDTANWQASIANVSSQLNKLAQNVANRLSVSGRWAGTKASLQAAMSVAGDVVTVVQGAQSFSFNTVNSDYATNENYFTQLKAQSWENLVLIHNTDTPEETGLYVVSGGQLQKFSPSFGQLRDGALIFVDAGAYANSFWTIADPTIVTANDVVIPSLIPFGSFTELTTDPAGFLSIAANQLNAALDGDYFVVVNGELTMTPAFVARVTNLESGLATAQADIDALESGLAQETINRQNADTAMNAEIQSKASAAALAQEVLDRQSGDAALQTAINAKASQAALDAEISTRIAADQALQTAIDSKASQAALDQEITDRAAADVVLQSAINTKASQVDLDAEISTRIAADQALQTAIDSKASQAALDQEIADRAAADVVLQSAINTKASQADLDDEVAARIAGDNALQLAVDSKASQAALAQEIADRTAADSQLAIDIAARVTTQVLHTTMANFAAYSNPVKTLTGGVFSTINDIPTTTFYVPLSDSLDWGISRYSESASPYINVAMPTVSYTNTNGTGANGFFAKLEFQHGTQVPDGEIEIFLQRHYRAGVTPIGFF